MRNAYHPRYRNLNGLGDYYDNDGNLVEDGSGYTPAPGETIPGGAQPGPTLAEQQWGKTINTIAPGTTAIMAQVAQPGDDWLTTLQRVLQTVTLTEQQRSLFNAQIARAQQGLPPLAIGANGQLISSPLNPNTVLMLGALLAGAIVLSKR